MSYTVFKLKMQTARLLKSVCLVFMVLIWGCSGGLAGQGTVKTTDGKTLVGELSLEAEGVKIRQPGSKSVEMVEPGKVKKVVFDNQQPRERRTKEERSYAAGLQGNYFSQTDLNGQKVMRRDENLPAQWTKDLVPAGISLPRFSARWEGWLTAPRDGKYTFSLQGGNGYRLYLQDQCLINEWQVVSGREFKVQRSLSGGKKIPFKLEYRLTNDHGSLRLSWEGPGFGQTPVPASCFSCPGDVVELPLDVPSQRGLVLCDGSFLAGNFRAGQEGRIRIGSDDKSPQVSLSQVSRIYFRDLNSDQLKRAQSSQAGAMLANGDFVEGEIKAIVENQVKISSVLFGIQTYDQNKTVFVSLRESSPGPAGYQILLRNGSILHVEKISFAKGMLMIADGPLTGHKFNAWEISEFAAPLK